MTKREQRTLHLIDIENLAGSSSPTAQDVGSYRDWYEPMFVGESDLVVIAYSHHAFPAIGWEWRGVRHILRSGENCADLALLEVVALERVAARFRAVIVGSGDGIFTDMVAQLGAAGVYVTVVSRPESLSRSLRLAARRHVLVPRLRADVQWPLESA